MATKIERLEASIDALAAAINPARGPVRIVVGDASEGPAAIAVHLSRYPGDEGREVTLIATGVPRSPNR